MCETFDVVVSNPPFAVTLPKETQNTLAEAFTLPTTSTTEALFLERAFQLLRPDGRLAVVLPESVLNASDPTVRLFLLRMFHVRAVVTMPRHIFYDTPTLTSLLFAQKKLPDEIETWDYLWSEEVARIEARLALARRHLTKDAIVSFKDARELETAVLDQLAIIGPDTLFVMRRGLRNGPLTFRLPPTVVDAAGAARYYSKLFQAPGFKDLVTQAVFRGVSESVDADWPCYVVDEVGFKLSKRGERVRECQLANFVGLESGRSIPNLHLATENTKVIVNGGDPVTLLDFMATDVVWR